MELISKILGFKIKMQIVNVFDHYDQADKQWKGICGMVSFDLIVDSPALLCLCHKANWDKRKILQKGRQLINITST